MKYSFFLGGYFNNSNQSEFIRDAILAYCQKVSPDFNSFMTEDHNTNHSIDLHCKSMDLFLYDRDLRRERVYFQNISTKHCIHEIESSIGYLFNFSCD